MNRLTSIIIICLLIVIILVMTNPGRNDFIDWAVEQEDASNELEAFLGEIIESALLRVTTDRRNYVIFSIFTVQDNDEEIMYIGFLRRIFIRISD